MLDGRRVAGAALLLLPAGLTAFFAFNSGGFYPGPPAYVAVLLCIVLALRATLGRNLFVGAGPNVSIASGALGVYALLTLVSQIWSHAPGTALEEFDRALVYLLVFVLFASIAHSPERLAWILRILGLAIFVICTCGLTTRLLPHLWPTTPGLANNRLSFPVTYWNALGILGAMGVVIAAHISSDVRERPIVRVLAAASIPILATTIYFTFSRGGIAGTFIGLIVYALIARPKLLLSTAIAVVPTAAIALKIAYDANLLATQTPTTSGAVAQGRHVAVAVILCVAVTAAVRGGLALMVDSHLARFAIARNAQARVRRLSWGTLIAALAIAGIALNGAIVNQYHRFLRSAQPGSPADLRARLTDPGNNGRIDMWRVAWHQFERTPLVGKGAGTFANTWAQYRPTQDFVVDAHSLYLETLDELGIVGFLLLVGVILAILISTASRARGPTRPLYAATFAVMLIWALHAGIDWDWEMPVVTLPFFALGGFMLSRPVPGSSAADEPSSPTSGPPPYTRVLVGLGCLLLAVAPTYMWLSQRRLDQATTAFAQRNCRAATDSALSSISILGNRPEPYEVISYCDIRRDMPDMAIAMINKAISLDPNNWNYTYDLAVMRASAGLDPMAAAHKALSLDPREPLVQQMVQTFAGGNRASWERDGKTIGDGFTTL
ncbi:MAG TPA: O-antigen ligase family protein [Solirubrobacteraceae bacterium]|nr:O-antigen ligase family protein [Solirubrobacteraceae bacterium]